MKTIPSALVLVATLTAAIWGADQSAPAAQQRQKASPATQPVAPLFVGDKPDEWKSYQEMHAYVLDRFVRSDGFGVSRMVVSKDAARNRKIYADATRYWVGMVQLISLNGGQEPFEYLTPHDASKDRLKASKHRPLKQFETDALKELQGGKDVVLTGAGASRALIGAVRASSSCIKCHEVKEGTLLGAFRYPLIEVAHVQR